MTHELIYPLVTTYFIAWGNDSISYGVNELNQCTTSGLANFEIFTDAAAYQARLLEFDIVLGEEE